MNYSEVAYQGMSLLNLLGCVSSVIYTTIQFYRARVITKEEHRLGGWLAMTCILVAIGQVWSLSNIVSTHWLLKLAGTCAWISMFSFAIKLRKEHMNDGLRKD